LSKKHLTLQFYRPSAPWPAWESSSYRGQILSGISPLVAIRYQIAMTLGIAGSVSLTVILLVQLGYKAFFNERQQLK
jgi:hypothetical protein